MKDRQIDYDTSTAFFINGEGGPLYHPKAYPINWGDFASTSGFSQKITSYSFRKNMSKVLVAEKSSLLVECEEYALCHSEGTRKKYYSDEQARMAKSLLGQEVYDKTVAGEEEAQGSTSKQSTISRRLKENHQVEMMNLDKKKVEQMVLADIDQAKEKKPVERSDGRTRLFGDHTKMALCDAIQQFGLGGDFGRELYLTKDGNALDLFFTGQPMLNQRYAHYLLRLVTMFGMDGHWSFEILKVN